MTELPKQFFCGWPIERIEQIVPCGRVATEGCAFCDEHGAIFHEIGQAERFARLLMKLTANDIVDRAAARNRLAAKRFARLWAPIFAALFLSVALYEPIHSWLHTHLQLLAGIVVGSLAEAAMWRFVEWGERRHGLRP